MATTIRIALRNRPKADGTYPIIIRITKHRKSSIISLGQSVHKKYWDSKNRVVRKSHPNSQRLNALLIKKLSKVNESNLNSQVKDKEASTAKDIKSIYNSSYKLNSFFNEAEIYLSLLKKEGKYNRYVSDKPRIERLKFFLKGRKVSFEELTISVLKSFKAWLKGEKKLSERSAINYLIVIRTIYNQGIKKGIVDQKYYPFGKSKIQIRFPEVQKVGLTTSELQTIRQLDLSANPKVHHSRNLFMTSFFLAGMRASDLFRLRWSDFINDRLYYTMGKNSKSGSLKVPLQVKEIIDEYLHQKRTPDDVIFPELKSVIDFENKYLVQRKISYGTKNANKYLKKLAEKGGVEKPMTMHIARHSFAGISGNKIPIQLLQKLYRHTSVTTTIEYQKSFTNDDIDEALDNVIAEF